MNKKTQNSKMDNFELNADDTWKIIDTFFEQKNQLSAHQINSFNRFMNENIPDIIQQHNPLIIKVDKLNEDDNKAITYLIKINLTNPRIPKPYHQENNGSAYPMYPNQARIRNLSYTSKLFVDGNFEVQKLDDKGNVMFKKVYETFKIPIGKIPIMLQSDFCVLNDIPRESFSTVGEDKFDYGGYFIINGSEKVVVAQKVENVNNVYLYKNGKGNPFPYVCKIESKVENKYEPLHIVYVKLAEKDNIIYGRILQQISADIPLFVLFRALGVIPDKTIMEYIVGDLNTPEAKTMMIHLIPTLEASLDIQTQESALEYLYNNSNVKKFLVKETVDKYKYILDTIERHLFPHVGDSLTKKAYYLGYMTRKLLLGKMEKIPVDDRDHLGSCKVKTTGLLMAELFLDAYQKLLDNTKNSIKKEFGSKNLKDEEIQDLLIRTIKTNYIDSKFKTALSTGNWGAKGDSLDASNTGVAQVLKRLSYLDMVSHLRKVVTPISAELKLVAPRLLNTTQFGYICPCESPEGGKVGLVKNMSLQCHITVGSDPITVISILEKEENLIQTEDVVPNQINYLTKVLINGDWIGSHPDPYYLLDKLRTLRRKGIINFEVGIYYEQFTNEIKINTEGGRFSRPLLIVKNNKLVITNEIMNDIHKGKLQWFNLISGNNPSGEAIIEYIDPMEEENSLIAVNNEKLKSADETINYSHCEIHPTMMLGIAASTIPFCNHNQAPRNVFQSAQVKQAIGIYASNYNDRVDKIGHVLHYPQKPLVTTRSYKYFHFEEIPGGINANIAISVYGGFNQEDSLIFNKGSIDRGLFTSTYYSTVKDDLSKGNKEYGKPDPNNTIKIRKNISFRHIDERGFVKPETEVEPNDVIIGKIQKTDKTSQAGDGKQLFTDESITLRDMGIKDKKATVDNVIVNQNGEGYPFCKVRLRKKRIPIIGDKYAALHGQKGTIGMILPHEDMPYNKYGVCPDLIVNPHAIPSRMTIGQLLEVVYSKAAALQGIQYDGTPFSGQSVEGIAEVLKSLGYEKYGNEVLYNGATGEQLEFDVFTGPCYYQKLKHMVSDKMHSRATGPVSLLTRQPLEGRSKEGGLRLGEMERDALISSGLTQFLREKFFEASDGATAKGLYTVIVCKTCGFFAQANKQANTYNCRHPDCQDKNNQYGEIYLSYACKLFFQELMSMCIAPRIVLNEPSI